MNHDELLTSIDACRAGSDDLASPELADVARRVAQDPEARVLYEEIQKTDTQVSAAMHDVAVPEGLEARLLAALVGGEVTSDLASAAEGHDEDALAHGDTVKPEMRRRSIRRWWPAGVGIAVAAALLIAFLLRPNEPIDLHDVLATSLSYFGDDRDFATGRLMAEMAPPDGLLPSARVIAPKQTTEWREIEGFLGRSGVAYDLQLAGQYAGTLYVVPARGRPGAPKLLGFPTGPPARPQSTTGGMSASAWITGGRLYVLVVKGGEEFYRRLLSAPGAMAFQSMPRQPRVAAHPCGPPRRPLALTA